MGTPPRWGILPRRRAPGKRVSVRTKVKSREDVFSLAMHELMHPLFNHYIYTGGALTNIACDAAINASIARFFPVHSDVGRLFTRCYADRGIEAVLRPGFRNVREGRFEDGYADMTEEHAEALKKRKVSTLTVISRPSQPMLLCEVAPLRSTRAPASAE